MASLLDRYVDRIVGTLPCYDRVIVHGSVRSFSYAAGMASFLRVRGVRVFEFPKFAMPFREAIRANAGQLAKENGLKVQFIRNGKTRKEDLVAQALEDRGDTCTPGLIAILSGMEC